MVVHGEDAEREENITVRLRLQGHNWDGYQLILVFPLVTQIPSI